MNDTIKIREFSTFRIERRTHKNRKFYVVILNDGSWNKFFRFSDIIWEYKRNTFTA